MRKKAIIYTISFLGMAFIFFGTPLITKNNTSDTARVLDLFNPFVKNKEVYVKTTDKYIDTYKSNGSDKELNYVYVTTSYDKRGKTRELKYVSFGKKLTPDKYLKVKTKGQDVRKWEEVTKEEVPEKALDHLN